MIVLDCEDRTQRADHIARAATAVRRGEVVIIPTESSYAIAADAFNPAGTTALRSMKGIGSHVPLAVMVPSAFTVHGLAASVPQDAVDLMTAFWPGLVTLLLPAQPTLAWDHPRGAPVAVRMPLHPVLLQMLAEIGPMAVTTANSAGLEPPLTVAEVEAQLGSGASFALDAGMLIDGPSSTIVDLTTAVPTVRRPGAVDIDDLRTVCPDVIAAS